MADLVLSYAEAAQAGPEVAGGKGWNLARLHRYGFLVPQGGIVIAQVYAELMAAPELRSLQSELSCVPAADLENPASGERLAALRTAIETAALPQEAVAQMRAFLHDADLAHVPLAVRSSATAEDSAAATFAGVHRTFLQARGLDDVIQAIKGCYASLWTPQALAYRRHLGLDDEAVACAVVICAMVAGPQVGRPELAGVAFTCDPRTGARDRVTISAVRGLGEALVSGRANPEELTVFMGGDGEPTQVRRAAGLQPILASEQITELVRLMWRVHWALGDGQDPQDVEWVYDGRRFWLVQARPVTHLPRVTAPAIAHLPTIWSNANLKDNLPGVVSPLGWSYLAAAVSRALGGEAASAAEPDGREMTRRFSGRPYMDMTTLQWTMYDTLGMTPRQLSQGIGGHQPQIPIPPGNPLRGKAGRRRLGARLKLLPDAIKNAWNANRDMARLRAEGACLRAAPFHLMSNAELIGYGAQIQAVFAECVRKFLFGAFGLWDIALAQLIGRYLPGRGQAVAAGLMAGAGGVVSAEHGYVLWDIAGVAASDAEARRYLEAEPLDSWGWRDLPPSSPFCQAFAAFLDEYGHRGVSEIDIANPRWAEDPGYLLREVRGMLDQDRSRSPREAAHAARRRAEAEVGRLPLLVRPPVHWLAARARHASARREAGKSIVASVTFASRGIALEAGRRLVAIGALTDPADVFYLAHVDFAAFLRGEWDGAGAAALAADRRAQREAWLTEAPPDLIILDAEGHPATMPESPPLPKRKRTRKTRRAPAGPAVSLPEGAIALQGTAASAGRASGPARVIRHPDQASWLQAGDVLVAPSTDPGWTPLFLRAAAIVMEVGGYQSHGAIVAREYGIPAVVNVPGVMGAVEDGQPITVDGDTGLVVLTRHAERPQAEGAAQVSSPEQASRARA
jgi:rifampicin phosphotransferase